METGGGTTEGRSKGGGAEEDRGTTEERSRQIELDDCCLRFLFALHCYRCGKFYRVDYFKIK